MRAYRGKVITLALVLVLSATGLMSPLLHGCLLDALHIGKSTIEILCVVGATVVLGVASICIGYWLEIVRMKSCAAVTAEFKSHIWRHLARIPLQELFKQSPGVWMQKVTGDAETICSTFQMLIFGLLNFGLFFIGTATIIFFKAPSMLAFFAVALLVGTWLHHAHRRRITKRARHLRNGQYEYNGIVFDLLMMQPLLRMIGLSTLFTGRFERRCNLVTKQLIASQEVSMRYSFWLGIEMLLVHGLVLTSCIVMYIHGHIALGDIWAYDMLVSQLSSGVNRLLEMLPQLDQGMECARALVQTLNIIEENPRECKTFNISAEYIVSVKNVSFHYDESETTVLRGCNLQIAPNEFVCLVGKNGTGKSTLINLILGIYRPAEGEMVVSARNTAIIPQHITIFRGSMLENVRLYDETITPKKVASVLNTCGLGSWVTEHKYGIYSKISAEIVSGGELQRLAIARAVVRDPDLLILDEVTNNLDVVEKERIHSILKGMKGLRTVVSVTHDLSSLEMYDRVFVFSHGNIQEVLRDDGNVLIGSVRKMLED